MPVNLHGTDYSTVAERLDLAHGGTEGRPTGIQSVATEFVPVGTALLCRATVTFQDGRSFTGTSEVPIDSKQPAERDAPFECGETSAVGRALANAGYPGSDKGLAGAEEIQRPPRRPAAAATKAAPETPETAETRPLRDVTQLQGNQGKPGQPTPAERWIAAVQALTGKGQPPRFDNGALVPEQPPAVYTPAEIARVATHLEGRLAGLQASAAQGAGQ